MKPSAKPNAISTGVALALASAFAFGLTIPALGWAGSAVGPFTTAALLYLGAGAAALVQKMVVREAGAPLGRGSVPMLLVVVVAGAAIAPALLALGIQLTGAVTAGLVLNMEAAWTVVLARVVFGEQFGRRVGLAFVLMVIGGCVLAAPGARHAVLQPLGVAAVMGATLAWGIDNTASRRLAELRPLTVVAIKGVLGAFITSSLAAAFQEHLPMPWQMAALLIAGATGYGASLRLYLLAQRKIGAARTASIFALAPFIGAAIALLILPKGVGWTTALAAVLFASGVALHASERHAHRHRHEPLEHDHAHRHDDGHHSHVHSPVVEGEHAHSHRHEPLEHAHEHGPDVHHGHVH